MLSHKRAQGSIKYLPAERELIVQVGLDQGNDRMFSLCHAQHLPGKVQPHRFASLPQHEAQMGAGAATGIEDPFRRPRSKERHGIAPVESDQWVWCLVVTFRPEIVTFTHAESGKLLAHTTLKFCFGIRIFSFIPKRYHRIDSRCAARWHPAREQGHARNRDQQSQRGEGTQKYRVENGAAPPVRTRFVRATEWHRPDEWGSWPESQR